MRNPAIVTTLSHSRIIELLDYNKHTGALTWRIPKARGKAGKQVGTLRKDGTIIVTIDRRQYLATRLVWFYVNGYWPEGRVTTHNHDNTDLRWRNIMLEKDTWSRSKTAIYQREYRERVAAMKRGEAPTYKPLAPDDPRSAEHVYRARGNRPSPYDRDSGVTDEELRLAGEAAKATEEARLANERYMEHVRNLPGGVVLRRGKGRPKGSKNKVKPKPGEYQLPDKPKRSRSRDE